MPSLDPRRAAEVWADEDTGSGYVIAPQLVLTAWHVLCPKSNSAPPNKVKVRIFGDYLAASGTSRLNKQPAQLIWPQSYPGDENDFALLKVTSSATALTAVPVNWIEPPQWGEATIEGVGFPRVRIFDNQEFVEDGREPFRERDTHPFSGKLHWASDQKRNLVYGRGVYDVVLSTEASPLGSHSAWEGVSGSAAFTKGFLAGIVTLASAEQSHRLKMLPVVRLFTREDVQDALRAAGVKAPQQRKAPGKARTRVTRTPSGTELRTPPVRTELPDLPTHYRPRSDVLEAVKSDLLPDSGAASTRRSQNVGLWGMPGAGKTTAAAAIATQIEVLDHFAYIVWITVGRSTDPLGLLKAFAEAITKKAPDTSTIAITRAGLSGMLRTTEVLVILDDVWKPAIVDAFRDLTSGVRLFVTTRSLAILERITASVHKVGVLDEKASIELFSAETGVAPLPDEATTIIKECGGLPLALAAAAAIVRRSGWQHAIETFKRTRLDKLKTERLKEPSYENLALVLAASVDQLPDRERRCFHECVAWPEDIRVPEEALADLWSEHVPDAFDVPEVIYTLVSASVLIRSTQTGHLRLHDLYLDYLNTVVDPLVKRSASIRLLSSPHAWVSFGEQLGSARLQSFVDTALSSLSASEIERHLRIRHLFLQKDAFLSCVTGEGIDYDPEAICSVCRRKAVAHGSRDLAPMRYDTEFYCICLNCFKSWHEIYYSSEDDYHWRFNYFSNSYDIYNLSYLKWTDELFDRLRKEGWHANYGKGTPRTALQAMNASGADPSPAPGPTADPLMEPMKE